MIQNVTHFGKHPSCSSFFARALCFSFIFYEHTHTTFALFLLDLQINSLAKSKFRRDTTTIDNLHRSACAQHGSSYHIGAFGLNCVSQWAATSTRMKSQKQNNFPHISHVGGQSGLAQPARQLCWNLNSPLITPGVESGPVAFHISKRDPSCGGLM